MSPLKEQQLQKIVSTVIRRRRENLDSEESDRQILTDYIRYFVEQKRGNAALLAKESSVRLGTISTITTGVGNLSSMERLLILSETIQKILKS
ncbi:hypothetical protein [Leptospira alexanderi]|uniref:hypothetical protein n=1 Tax=Leptospira alexanderi TaxID=100053 RepID=UPI001479BAE4|nr:hypothetical protein [Leptospira alexanderi]